MESRAIGLLLLHLFSVEDGALVNPDYVTNLLTFVVSSKPECHHPFRWAWTEQYFCLHSFSREETYSCCKCGNWY